MLSVLIVDDEKPVRDGLCSFVRTRGISADAADSTEAVSRLRTDNRYSVIVVGYHIIDAAFGRLVDAVGAGQLAPPVLRLSRDLPVDVLLSRLDRLAAETVPPTPV